MCKNTITMPLPSAAGYKCCCNFTKRAPKGAPAQIVMKERWGSFYKSNLSRFRAVSTITTSFISARKWPSSSPWLKSARNGDEGSKPLRILAQDPWASLLLPFNLTVPHLLILPNSSSLVLTRAENWTQTHQEVKDKDFINVIGVCCCFKDSKINGFQNLLRLCDRFYLMSHFCSSW